MDWQSNIKESKRENAHDAFKSRDDRLAVDNKPTYTQGARVSFYILMSASTSHDDSRPTYLELLNRLEVWSGIWWDWNCLHSVVRSLKNDSECVLWWKPCFVVFSRIGATNRRYKKIRNLTPCQNIVLNWKRSVSAILLLRSGTAHKTPVPLNHHDAERSK